MMKVMLAKIFRLFLLMSCKLLTGIQARWYQPPSDKTRIYYANHSSHLDGIVIWSCFPKVLRARIHPIAASDYWEKSAVRRFIAIDVFNSILINRKVTASTQNPIDIMSLQLKKQQTLILFPEGSRGNGDVIADFKSGLYHLAKLHPEVEIVPVYLNNLNRVMPKGSKFIVPIICSATFGNTLSPLALNETKSEFLARAKLALEELIP